METQSSVIHSIADFQRYIPLQFLNTDARGNAENEVKNGVGKKEMAYKGLLSFSPDIQKVLYWRGRLYKERNMIKRETPDVSGLGWVSALLQHLAHLLAPECEA